jgi:uncharacterized protein YdhG (YjbR/CyaY superfamily)
MARDVQSVGEYIATQPGEVQQVLRRVRAAIHAALPEIEEVISYKMPTFRTPNGIVLYLAAWKEHYSLYPATGRLLAAFKKELTPFAVNKSTIRFAFSDPVPAQLIERIAKFRSKELAARDRSKTKDT